MGPCARLLAVLRVQSSGERLIFGGRGANSRQVCKAGPAPVNKAREQLSCVLMAIHTYKCELNSSLMGIIGRKHYFDIGIKPTTQSYQPLVFKN